MAFANKIGNLFKQALTSNPSVYKAVRCMSSSKLFIGGISFNTNEQSLADAFTNYGEVVEARIIMDRETGRSRGFGFVTFASCEEASAAIIAMDGKDLHGRIVKVDHATDRTGGFRSGYDNSNYSGNYGGGGGGNYGGTNYGSGGGGGNYGGTNYGSGGGSYGSNYDSGGGGNYVGSGGYGGGNSSYRGDNYSGSGDGGENYSVAGGGMDGGYDDGGRDLLRNDFKDDDLPDEFSKRA